MHSQPDTIDFQLPTWVNSFSQHYQASLDPADKMKFIIAASKKNIEEGTGGPFAAGIFNMDNGELVALGVNLVTTEKLSILHAEMVAITIAQRKLDHYDLGNAALPRHELVTSTEPCAMCFGAIPWSGVRRVVTAAYDKDARAIGFDEGPKPQSWVKALTDRGIEVISNVEREEARSVLQLYQQTSGHIYNSREK